MSADPGGVPDARRRMLSLSAVIASALGVGLTFGMSVPLIALLLDRGGESSTVVGLNSAAASLAVLLIGPFIPSILAEVGILRAMLFATAGCAAILLLIPAWPGTGPWFLLRFLLGGLGAIHWIVSETWIVTVAHKSHRGRALGIYVSVISIGFALGPMLINFIGPAGFKPFAVAALLFLISAVPLLLARGHVPGMPAKAERNLGMVFRTAPFIFFAAALSGLTDTSLLSLLHIYGLHSGIEQGAAVFMLTVAFAGTVACQFPIGWLADRMDRKTLLQILIILFIAIPLLVPATLFNAMLLWPLLLLWGGVSMGVYTICLSMLGDRFGPAMLPGANAAFVMIYELGSMTGPVWSGAAMDMVGPSGFLWALAIPAAVFLLSPLRRK